MRIIHFAENDPAGMGIGFTKAINKHTEHHARLVTWIIKYNFLFEKDFHIPVLNEEGFEELYEEMKEADIFHFHTITDETYSVGKYKISDFIKGKKILHHHHGHPVFRNNPKKFQDRYKINKRKPIVSTPDLLKLLPIAEWQPNLVPINDPLYMPPASEVKHNKKISVCHSPTKRELKNTSEFENVMNRLGNRYPRLEKVMIENTLYTECLKIKQECDICFDHMQGYYGVSSLESLSQGKPVIAGLDAFNIKTIKDFTNTEYIPWIIARSETELEENLEKLVQNPEIRLETGRKARKFMEDYWSDEIVVNNLCRIYNNL